MTPFAPSTRSSPPSATWTTRFFFSVCGLLWVTFVMPPLLSCQVHLFFCFLTLYSPSSCRPGPFHFGQSFFPFLTLRLAPLFFTTYVLSPVPGSVPTVASPDGSAAVGAFFRVSPPFFGVVYPPRLPYGCNLLSDWPTISAFTVELVFLFPAPALNIIRPLPCLRPARRGFSDFSTPVCPFYPNPGPIPLGRFTGYVTS